MALREPSSLDPVTIICTTPACAARCIPASRSASKLSWARLTPMSINSIGAHCSVSAGVPGAHAAGSVDAVDHVVGGRFHLRARQLGDLADTLFAAQHGDRAEQVIIGRGVVVPERDVLRIREIQ